MKNKGFMMMEMIIVIIIIGILAALLLPALSAVDGKAKEAKCKANMSQMGKGMMLYQMDYGRNVRYPDSNGGGFLAKLYSTEILMEEQVFVCPATDDYTDGKLLQQLGEAENGEDGDENVISYGGRKNKNQLEYPGIFRMHRDTSITTIGADDWQGQINHERRGDTTNVILFLDGHVDTIHEIMPNYQELIDPLTN